MKKVISALLGVVLFLSTAVYSQPGPNVTTPPEEEIIEKVIEEEPEEIVEEEIIEEEPEEEINPYETDISLLAEKLAPTVVSISVIYATLDENYYRDWGGANGSGVFITSNGHILTCAHLFHGVTTGISVQTQDETFYGGELLYIDRIRDLALIKIYADEETPYAKISERDAKLGETVIAIGHPLGLEWTFTTGIVSGIDRILDDTVKLTQMDAVINPGSSGGPLYDITGEIIGINVKVKNNVYIRIWTGQGFAVSAEEIRKFMDRFKGL